MAGSIVAAMFAGTHRVSANAAQNSAHKTTTKSNTTPHSTAGAAKPFSSSKGKSSKTGKSSSKRGKKVKGQAAPTPDRINEIQMALAKNGSFDGTLTSKWDDDTVAAVKRFQGTHGLNPSGKLDAHTLQKLGLGSETAGLGAPTPPPNSAANRLLSSKAQREEQKNDTDVP